MEVKFNFELDQKVKTIFGDYGIIEMAGIDKSGKKYFVKRSQEDKWFFENEIEAILSD